MSDQPSLSVLEREILQANIENECVELIKELVPLAQPECANSLEPEVPGGCEKEIAVHLFNLIKQLGFKAELVESVPDRPNVVGVLEGETEGPTLILNDHLDTYPSGDPVKWTETEGDPFFPTIKGRYIYGRGTSDTRGNLAVILLAIRLLKRLNVSWGGKLVCAFTVDEEKNGKHGALYLLNEYGLKGDYEITCEPTGWTEEDGTWGMGIASAHAGHCMLDLTVHGRSSHLWRPDVGTNANDMMALLINKLNDFQFTYEEPLIQGPTGPKAFMVRMEGGKIGEGQFTPYVCKARVAVVGLVPGMTQQSVLADLNRLIETIRLRYPDFKAEFHPLEGETFVSGTVEVDPKTEHLRQLMKSYQLVLNEQPSVYRKNAYCDTIRFSHAGIPSLTFGPGEDGWDPINEYIHIDKVVAAVKILALTISGVLQCKVPSENKVSV